jgi:cytochrome o ubiquinol oxidase subunit 1
VIIAVMLILGWITVKGYWPYLWREWITSVDHKRIGRVIAFQNRARRRAR